MLQQIHNRKRLLKWSVFGFTVLFFVCLACVLFQIKTVPIDMTMCAALIDYQSCSVEHVHLMISGVFQKRIIGHSRFDGTISIPEIGFNTSDKSWIAFSITKGGIILRNRDAMDTFSYGRIYIYDDDFWPLRIEWSHDPHNGGNGESEVNRWLLTAPIYGLE